ncbi:hypothetical protein [Aestuariispira insulae]|uniref:Uncharacterized protein n=1 Tax=Aestuariispira insulae TaxID=1461337 RepID=A0A3D9HTI1_9PROT|nr:hypothetical protein [Aestuariispira insulae]RED52186.1 hypothetical protein DFP90_102204 [Aestuariispira insulae]
MGNIPDSNRAFRMPGMDLGSDGSGFIAKSVHNLGETFGRAAPFIQQAHLLDLKNRQMEALQSFHEYAGARLAEAGQEGGSGVSAIGEEEKQRLLMQDLENERDRLLEGIEFYRAEEREAFLEETDEAIETTGLMMGKAREEEIRNQTLRQLSKELSGMASAIQSGDLGPDDGLAGAVRMLNRLEPAVDPGNLEQTKRMIGRRFLMAYRNHLIGTGDFEQAASLFRDPDEKGLVPALFSEQERAAQADKIEAGRDRFGAVKQVQNGHALRQATRHISTPEEAAELRAVVDEGVASGKVSEAAASRVHAKLDRREPALQAKAKARARVFSVLEGAENTLSVEKPEDRRAVDQVYGEWLEARRGRFGMELAETDLAIDLFDETGILPRQAAMRVRKALSGRRGSEILYAMDWIETLEAEGQLGQLELSDEEYALAVLARQESFQESFSEEDVLRLRATTRPDEGELKARQEQLQAMQPTLQEWSGRALSKIFERHRQPMRFAQYLSDDFNRSYANWYLKTGDAELARDMGTREMLAVWSGNGAGPDDAEGPSIMARIGADIAQFFTSEDPLRLITHSIPEAGKQMLHSINDLSDWLGEKMGVEDTRGSDYWARLQGIREEDLPAYREQMKQRYAEVIEAIPQGEEPETGTGKLVGAAVQFLAGYGAARKALAMAGGSGGLLEAGAAGMLSEATAFDPLENPVNALVEAYPTLDSPVTDFLAADPDDPMAENRLKNALVGAGFGLITEGLMRAFRQMRSLKRRTSTEDGRFEETDRSAALEDAADEKLEQIADALEQAQFSADGRQILDVQDTEQISRFGDVLNAGADAVFDRQVVKEGAVLPSDQIVPYVERLTKNSDGYVDIPRFLFELPPLPDEVRSHAALLRPEFDSVNSARMVVSNEVIDKLYRKNGPDADRILHYLPELLKGADELLPDHQNNSKVLLAKEISKRPGSKSKDRKSAVIVIEVAKTKEGYEIASIHKSPFRTLRQAREKLREILADLLSLK